MRQAPADGASEAQGLLRFRRVMGGIAATLGLSVVFVTSLVGSVLLHLNTRPVRGTARTIANQVFDGLFQGKLVLGEIDRLSLQGVTVRSAEAFDASGARVAHVDKVVADANVIGLAKGAVLGSGELAIMIPRILVGNVDLALDKGPDGVPSIASVFLPRTPSPPGPPSARPLHLTLAYIQLGHAWAHGDLAPQGLDAEVANAIAKVEVNTNGVTVDVDPADLAARSPLPQPLAAKATFHLTAGTPAGVTISAGVDGNIGAVDFHTVAQMAGTHLSAHVEVPHATGGAIASLIPGPPPNIPLRVPVSATVDAEGNLPELVFHTKLDLDEEKGSISADGTIALASPLTVDVAVGVRDVDARAILDVPSATPLSADAHVYIEVADEPKIDATLKTKPFSLAGQAIPAVDVKATLAKGKVLAAVEAAEPGAPVHATVTVDTKTQDIGFDVTTRVASLSAYRRVVLPVEGSASVNVKGWLKKGAIDARVSAALSSIRAPGAVALDSGGIAAHVYGTLDGAPKGLQLDATVTGSGLQAGYYAWQNVAVHARGPLLAPHVDAKLDTGPGESLEVSAAVDGNAKMARDIDLKVTRNGSTMAGRVGVVAATSGGVKVEGLSLEGGGIGGLRGALAISGKEIVGKLRGENVDLEKVAALASYPGHVAGLANIDIDLSSRGAGNRKGHVALEFVNVEAALLKGVSGTVNATFDGANVRTDALVRVVAHAAPNEKLDERCDGAIAQIRITGGDGKLPGALLDIGGWKHATGHIEVAADDWNLRCVSRLVPASVTQLPEMRGKLTTRVVVDRDAAARLPVLKSLLVRTRGLELKDKTWSSLHTDVQLDAAVDTTSGDASVKLGVLDGTPLLTVSANTKLDVAWLLDHMGEAASKLMHTPMHVAVSIPRSPVTAFAGLPTFVTDRVPLLTGKDGDTLGGDIELSAAFDGTPYDPRASAHLKTYGVAEVTLSEPLRGTADAPLQDTKTGEKVRVAPPAVLGAWGFPLDVDATVGYDGQKATLDATIGNNKRIVTKAKADLALPIAEVMAGKVLPKGSAQVDVADLPLEEVPFLGDHEIKGKVNGSVVMKDLGDKPSLAVDIKATGLSIGQGLVYDKAAIAVDIPAPKTLNDDSPAKVSVDLSGPKAGSFSTHLETELKWLMGVVPTIDPKRAAKVEIDAKKFRIAIAQPFVSAIVSHMDGLLDGGIKADWNDGGNGQPRIERLDLALSDGIFNLPQLGEELHDVGLKLAADAKGLVKVNDLRAQGTKGLLTGGGYAQFNGVAFKKAEIALNIKKGDALPISLEGVPLGEATGSVKLSAESKQGGALELKVSPRLEIELAAALGRSVQSQDDNVDVTILQAPRAVDDPQPAGSASKVTLVVDPMSVTLHGKLLGKVPIEGTVTGTPRDPIKVVTGGKHARITGLISIPHFTIEVFHGKKFLIEGGSVKLNPDDAARSFVNATASWDSSDGTTFNIDFVGEATPFSADKVKDKLKCRASGGGVDASGDKCFSALLLGPDSANANSGGGQGQTLAAQLIASQFSADIGGGLSANLGTTDDGSFKPGIQYNVGKAILEASTYGVSGSSTTTTTAQGAQTQTAGQHYLITLDWRFWRNWSVRGKVDIADGNQAYGADLVWQYRY